MPSVRVLDGYRRRLRALEAAEAVAAERVRQLHCAEASRAALRNGPPLDWLQPVRCRDGVARRVLIRWQPWMGPKARLIDLIDAAEDAAHGDYHAGNSLDLLNARIRDILCSGPEGAAWVQRLADAAQRAADA